MPASTLTNTSDSRQSSPAVGVPERDFHPRCKVCQSADRGRIELHMVRGAGKRATARAFGLSEASIWRHWARHVPAKLKAARRVSVLKPGANLETLVNEESTGVLESLKVVRAALLWQFDQATQVEDRHGMAILSAQLHKNLETVARLTGELINRSEHTTVSVLLTAEYLQLRNALVRALTPYPDARRAVADVLHKIEGETSQRPPVRVLEASSASSKGGGHAAAH